MGSNTYLAGVHLPGNVARDKTAFTMVSKIKGTGIVLQSDFYGDSSGGYATGWAIYSNVLYKSLYKTSKKTVEYGGIDFESAPRVLAVSMDHYGDAVVYVDGVMVVSGDLSGDVYYDGRYYADTGENI
jgi:hypothetical protein